ncbi:HAMP domain-containing sensor histidine kinase [Bacillus spongiae]|uniref:histidine kinase n=1 Tax=Bacillus spongiae TaxID=2683610 RepID=A0ABU8HH17_9BACI
MKLKYHIPLLFLIIALLFFFVVLLYIKIEVREKITSEISESNQAFIDKHSQIAQEVGKRYPDQEEIVRYLEELGEKEELIIKLIDPEFKDIIYEFNAIEKEITTGDRWLPVKTSDGEEIVLFLSAERKLEEINNEIFRLAIDMFLFVLITNIIISILLTLYFHDTITRPITNLINRFKRVNLHETLPKIEMSGKGEIGELYNRFYELESRLQRVHIEQTNMLTAIAHDLKTPLTTISGFLELSLSSKNHTSEQREEFLKVVQKKSTFMTDLVNEFSSYAENIIALQEMNRSEMNISHFLHSIGEEYEAELSGLGYTFNWKHNVSDKLTILGNEKFLRRIFANIVSNSIKYAENEELTIQLEGIEKQDSVVITLEDNGVGVNEEDYPLLFQKFFTVDQSRQREKGGTGLGLAIVKSIVESHEGTVYAYRSKELGGLGIKVTLPIVSKDS